MARPLWNTLWFKLFGPDGPQTLAEFRDAIISGQFQLGQDVGEGGFIARFHSLLVSSGNVPSRPDQHADVGRNGTTRSLESSIVLDLRLPAIPGAAVDGLDRFILTGADTNPASTLVTDPEHAALPGGGRIATLFVAADPLIAAGLMPIEYGPTNRDDPFHDATRDNPFGNGWLATWLALHQDPMQISWDADALGSAADDLGLLLGPVLSTVVLSGDFSAGYTLAPQSMELDQVTLAAGSNYNLLANADTVGAGQSLTIDAQALGAGDHVAFDGSAVTTGSLNFLGGAGDDSFFGGAGGDSARGGAGADTLTGGGGSDTFVYLAAGDSTGTTHDILADFNPAQDKIDLPGTVTGFDAAVQAGSLSAGSFNADLGAALSGLGAGHAVVYAPNAGDLAGKIFLVVDANGVAGYQAGADFVFELPATTLADLSAHPNFFI